MKIVLIIMMVLFCVQSGFAETFQPYSDGMSIPLLLPEEFPVYYIAGQGVINHTYPGAEKIMLPTINHYTGPDGGYVAVYKHGRQGGLYPVGGDIYVVGQIRVKGRYINRVFYPDGYSEGADITQDSSILAVADSAFPRYAGDLWVGGDTGGWFGMSADGQWLNCRGETLSYENWINFLENQALENDGYCNHIDNVWSEFIFFSGAQNGLRPPKGK